MENPDPVREHRELEKLTGHYSGPERMHSSYFNEGERKARATTDARLALDGFAVVQDYTQELEDGTRFAGHGVFRYDMPSDTYELHWFDSTGGPERVFRGGFADNVLVLTARVGAGWQRLTYDFNLEGGYRLKIETSEDGERWNVAIEGDNFVERTPAPGRAVSDTTREGARKARRKKATGKSTAKKASPKSTSKKKVASKATTRKATGKKAAPKKATGKKSVARKATAKKKTAKKKVTAKKAVARKSAAKKTTGKKATARKAAAKKPGAKKTAARKKAGAKQAAAKSASRKKAAAPRKAAAKKAAKKTPKRKVAARTRVSALERDRRQGKASRKIGPKKKRTSTVATRTAVSQKKTKSAAQAGPRMPNLKKTSTRAGRHKTAAKGEREI